MRLRRSSSSLRAAAAEPLAWIGFSKGSSARKLQSIYRRDAGVFAIFQDSLKPFDRLAGWWQLFGGRSTPLQRLAIGLLIKIRNDAVATALLLRCGLRRQAQAMSRVQFEALLTLGWLQREPDDAIRVLESESTRTWGNMLSNIRERRQLDELISDERLTEMREARASRPKVKELAMQLGLESLYGTQYRYASIAVHTGLFSISDAFVPSGSELTLNLEPNADDRAVVVSLVEAIFNALSRAAIILNLDLDIGLEALRERLRTCLRDDVEA